MSSIKGISNLHDAQTGSGSLYIGEMIITQKGNEDEIRK